MPEEDKSKEPTTEETEVKEPEQSPGTKSTEKTLTQTEFNKAMADQRRKYEADIKKVQADFDGFKSAVEAQEKAANDAAAEKVETLRKDLPEPIIKLLDNLSPVAQLEWLSDPANVITKKEIPPLPNAREQGGPARKTLTIV